MIDVERYGLTVAEVTEYCRCDDVRGADREVVPLMEAAYRAVSSYINRPIEETLDEAGRMTPDVCLAVKLFVAHWYDNRGLVTASGLGVLPFAVGLLLKDYVKLGGR